MALISAKVEPVVRHRRSVFANSLKAEILAWDVYCESPRTEGASSRCAMGRNSNIEENDVDFHFCTANSFRLAFNTFYHRDK